MKFSIVTVSLNSSRYIRQTIESVLGQEYGDFEYLVIDGQSTDGTAEIVAEYARHDKRISWISEPDRGIADAMNKGVLRASGEVVAHLNSDDYYRSGSVLAEVAESFAAHPDRHWLTAGFDFVRSDSSFLRSIPVRRYSFNRLLRGNILLHPSTFIKKELFEAVGLFDVKLRYCMDYDLFIRLGRHSPPIVFDRQLACFRVHGSSLTVSTPAASYREEFEVKKRYLREIGRPLLPYYLDYGIKRLLNRYFYNSLLSR